MPTTRQAFVPQPVVGRSAGELRGYVDGEDPVNGGPFMQRVLEGLTNPLDDEDLQGVSFDRSAPSLLEPDTEDAPPGALRRRALDGLPAHRPAHRGAGAGDARRHEPCARRGGWAHAADRLPRVLGVHRREGRRQCSHGGRATRVPAGHPRRDGGRA
jgi:hypothetical protein